MFGRTDASPCPSRHDLIISWPSPCPPVAHPPRSFEHTSLFIAPLALVPTPSLPPPPPSPPPVMRAVLALFSFAASALAYSVTEPDATTGWTTSGPNVVVWSMVSTDPANFTIVLDNQVCFTQCSRERIEHP